MKPENITLSYSLYSNKGVFALFLGSGISRSAGIPTGWEIIIDHLTQLATLRDATDVVDLQEWYKQEYGNSPDYSDLLELLTGSKSERNNALKRFFEPTEEEMENGLKQPTKAHRCIAKLVKRGYIKVIVTTNFDRLIENALKDEGIEPVVISNPNHIENVQPLIHNRVTLIKINGDYLDTEFLNLKSELSSYQPEMVALLNTVFENFGLLTCGWSASWDHALVNILKSSNKFRYSNYFIHKGEPSLELAGLCSFRSGKLLQVSDADDFFKELNENVESLEKINDEHPLNEAMSLAKLKKLLAKEESHIDLHDFLMKEADELYSFYTNWNHPDSNHTNLRSAIEMSLSKNQTINRLIANGLYFGNSDQHGLWIKIINKFLYPKNRGQYGSLFLYFDYFPSLQLMYSSGVAAVLRKDFDFLARLFLITKASEYSSEDENILQVLNPPKMFYPDDLKKAFANNYKTPFSELFFHQLKPLFSDLVANEEEYAIAFDYFEYIMCLVHQKCVKDYTMPYGRFAYRRKSYGGKNNITYKKVSEADIKLDDFELVTSKLFSDYKEYSEANSKVDGFLKDMYFH